MLLAGYDEAFDIPTEDTARLALRTQQIVGYESDATATRTRSAAPTSSRR